MATFLCPNLGRGKDRRQRNEDHTGTTAQPRSGCQGAGDPAQPEHDPGAASQTDGHCVEMKKVPVRVFVGVLPMQEVDEKVNQWWR